MRILYQVAVATVHDRHDVGARDPQQATVRLVSVVVPDWLMAITKVPDMWSGRPSHLFPPPESSVAGIAFTGMSGQGRESRAAATALAATAAVPWPMT